MGNKFLALRFSISHLTELVITGRTMIQSNLDYPDSMGLDRGSGK